MQSIFRMPTLPWTPGSVLDKAHNVASPFNTVVDLSNTGNVTKTKRKRTSDSLSPRSSPLPTPAPKKITSQVDLGGAVQFAPEQYMRGSDGGASFAGMNTIAPMPTNSFHVLEGPGLTPFITGDRAVQTPSPLSAQAAATAMKQEAPPFEASAFVKSATTNNTVVASTPNTVDYSSGDSIVTHFPVAGLKSDFDPDTTSGAQDLAFSSSPAIAGPPVAPGPPQLPESVQSQPRHVHMPKPNMKVNQDHLRAIVTAEINQAILFKHNELRLIDQEIAKCQVALEQLRRCSLIPFPGTQGYDLGVATHSNPSLATPNGMTIPREPAPWGVTDGPYTRHYATWLLPSPLFDPRAAVDTPGASPFPRDGRVTRGSGADTTPLSVLPSARSVRASSGRGRSGLETQSPMQQRDPLVIKRHQDGQWVKLYCSECKPERSDFANVQGFLNHCRISHKQDYKSHEAAAIACGRVVQVSEGATIAEPVSIRDVAPRLSLSSSISYSDQPMVHPLIKGSKKSRAGVTPLQQIVPRSYSMPSSRQVNGLTTPTTPSISATFKAANETPYLSKLMAQQGFSGDFGARVSEAKQRVDLTVYSDSESEPDMPNAKKPKIGKKKGPVAVRGTQSKPSGPRQTSSVPSHRSKPSSQRPILPPLPQLVAPGSSAASSSLPTPDSATGDVDVQLSPHASESNPGLVSDRDEDNEDEDEMEVDVASNASRPDAEMVVKIEDGDDEEVEETPNFCATRGANTC